MHAWVKQADVDAGSSKGLTTSEREELAPLRRENRRLSKTWRFSSERRLSSLKETR